MSRGTIAEVSPLMQQYRQLKAAYRETVLFFRVGDFYEMFYDDALFASKFLDIALTSRDKSQADPIPLCGVPYHAATPYIAKLLKAGRKVALCEQVEDAKQVKDKRPVRREVVRVYTPGTLVETEFLESRENNYIAALAPGGDEIGLASLDLSTGEFLATEIGSGNPAQALADELASIDPQELLLPEGPLPPAVLALDLTRFPSTSYLSRAAFEDERAKRILCEHFPAIVRERAVSDDRSVVGVAAGVLLGYVKSLQPAHTLSHITELRIRPPGTAMILDAATQRNLELIQALDGQPEGSLRSAIDRTLTPMGARMLKQWILHPLVSAHAIRRRQDAVAEFCDDFSFHTVVRDALAAVSDLERVASRIAAAVANARDLLMLGRSLTSLPHLGRLISHRSSRLIEEQAKDWDSLQDIHEWISGAIHPDPPISVREGGIINDSYSEELDGLRTVSRDGKHWISQMESEERGKTGIDSLKIRYNQVFGYAIEVTRANLSRVPERYIRRQTLVNAERFVTPELKDLEGKILSADEKIRALEFRLFEELRMRIAKQLPRIQTTAHRLALLDVCSALAQAARELRYVKPDMTTDLTIRITDGRHPVVERCLGPGSRRPDLGGFIPNDVVFDDADQRMMIITGPNMAGKSTYLRQVALIVILAQMGSFVPAKSAVIGIVDRIFTRIGASDNLAAGLSTFMVEMTETANILHHATRRSLILLDEIGRGTSTFDGLSIAWAVAEYIHTHRAIEARTLFATHYHELTDLANTQRGVKNYHVAVQETGDTILFLRKIIEGKADRSYGIQVARLAGLPELVVQRASEILRELEGSPRQPVDDEAEPDRTPCLPAGTTPKQSSEAVPRKRPVHPSPDGSAQMWLFS